MSAWNRKLRTFFATEAAGGIFLVGAAVVALVLANSPVKAGFLNLTQHSHIFVNEFLMSIFFFLVGLEIRREFSDGELRDPKKAALPVIAALGGMITPALIYLTFNSSGLASKGWAVPMTTDIALALGVLALLGARVDTSLKIFLLTLAIADDLFSIVIMAIFFRNGLELIRVIGTIGAVLLAIIIPVGKKITVSRLIDRIHPWSAFVIIPLFALVNIGITVDIAQLSERLNSPVARGIIVGRVIGKFVGITFFAWLAIKVRVANKPESLSFAEISGAAALAGMGLTVSLFIAELALTDATAIESVKLGLLLSAIIAGSFGYLLLRNYSKPED